VLAESLGVVSLSLLAKGMVALGSGSRRERAWPSGVLSLLAAN